MLKKLKFISFKSPWSHFENEKSQFSKNSLWSNHRIPYFVDKACFAKPWNSLFFGEVLFAENTKFLIFWTPYFRRSTVYVIYYMLHNICIGRNIKSAEDSRKGSYFLVAERKKI